MRFLFLFFILYTYLFAVVDIATIDFGDNSEGFSGSVYGSFEKKRGNTNKDDAEFGGRIQYDTKKTISWIQGEVENDESNGVSTDDNSFTHLRHIHQLYSPSWAWESFIQGRRDKFKNLDRRFLLGLGGRYRITNSDEYGKFFMGVSLMDERINYADEEMDEDEHNTRFNSYLSYKININNNLELASIAYYQPQIDHSSDYMFSSLSEMTIHLTKVIDLSYVLEFDYDSQPVSNVDTTDVRQKLSFVYRFGKDDPFSAYATNFLNSLDDLKDRNNTNILAVEIQTEVKDIKNSKDTLAGEWTRKDEVFNFKLDGKGSYLYNQGLYHQKFEWKLISTDTQEGASVAKEQSTKIVVVRYVDEEGRIGRIENYLWHENKLVGLNNRQVKVFRR